MNVDLLHIAECPSWHSAYDRLRLALDATGHADTPIDVALIDTPEDARRTAFAGSPTILIDGADLFPSDAQVHELACRIYFTPLGIAGAPTQEQIATALVES